MLVFRPCIVQITIRFCVSVMKLNKAAFVFLIDVYLRIAYHRFNAFGANLSFLKSGLGVRILPEEDVIQ